MRCAYPSVVLPCCLRYDNTEQDDGKGTRTCLKRAAAHAEQLVEQRLDRSVLRNHGDDLSSSNQRKNHDPPQTIPKRSSSSTPTSAGCLGVGPMAAAGYRTPHSEDIAPLPILCVPSWRPSPPRAHAASSRAVSCRSAAAAVPRIDERERRCWASRTNRLPARRTCWTCRSRTTTRPSRLPRRPRRIILNH